jgi:hypothetical protein
MVPTAVLHAMIALPTQKQPWKDRSNVPRVMLVLFPAQVVLNAKRVERVPMVMDVNPVPKGNTVTAVTQLRSPAGIAHRVITTTMSAKDHVCHVFL